MSGPGVVELEFAWERRYRWAALPFGVTPGRTRAVVDDDRLTVRFGPWRLATPLPNIAGTERTGPYSPLKTMGPAHLSLADRGLTLATTSAGGVCVRFVESVACLDPTGRLRHPAVTLTVADPDALERALAGAS